MKEMMRGQIYYADLSSGVGSEQSGRRPVLVIQNDIGNNYSTTLIVAAITSQISKKKLPTHVEISKEYGLEKDSVILMEQIRTIDKRRITDSRPVAQLDDLMMRKVETATMISLGMVG